MTEDSTSRPAHQAATQRDGDAQAARVGRLQPGPGGSPGANRLAALAAQLLDASAAVVTLTAEFSHAAGTFGMPGITTVESVPLAEMLCSRVARGGRTVSILDTRAEPSLDGLHVDDDRSVGSFLGVPLRADDRVVVGALSVFDPNPRIWSQQDVKLLEQLSVAAATELEMAALSREYDQDRRRWDQAIDAAGIGNFDWDLRTGRLVWDQTLITLFGYDGDEQFNESIDDFNARLHPDDVPQVALALQTAIDTIGTYEAEYRVLLPGGTTRRVQARGRALGEARAVRVMGSAWDISATRGAEEHAANILDGMPVGYVSLTPELIVRAMNSVAERLLRILRVDLAGRTLWEVMPEGAADTLAGLCRDVHRSGQAAETELFFTGGIQSWLEARVWPEATGIALYLTDITTRRQAQDEVERTAEYYRTTALALQDAMLTQLPRSPELEIGARYRTAATQARVGGDWYDAIVQSDGATTFMVGDVTGHDIQAAAVMGQLRSMLRVLAWQGDDPPAVLIDRLDHAIADLHGNVLATVVAARVETGPDADERVLRWSTAGHPPPVLLHPDGTSEILDSTGLMLGVKPSFVRRDDTVALPAGSTVVLYTDGLVERRADAITDGIARLAAAAERHHHLGVEEFLDAVLGDMVAQDPDDDVVVLTVRVRDRA